MQDILHLGHSEAEGQKHYCREGKYFWRDMCGVNHFAQYTVYVHGRALADVAIVLHMLFAVLAYHLILLIPMYVQEACGQYHQICGQQEEAFQPLCDAFSIQFSA